MGSHGRQARAGVGPGTGKPLRVLLTTESTYPFHWGGLSTWCHALIRELPDVDFSLLAVAADPFAQAQFDLPPNLVDFRPLPLWGLSNGWEIDRQTDVLTALRRHRRTDEGTVEVEFVPSYRVLLGQLLGDERDDEALATALLSIYRFFGQHDYDRTFRSRVIWNTLVEMVGERYPTLVKTIGYEDTAASVAELSAAAQWIYHWLLPLSRRLPEVDIAHATMAGICSLVAVVCKLDQGAGCLLSEHGIYLRECYLAEHGSSGSLFGKLFKVAFARRMTELAYAYADAVAPCCDYNHRWESRVGVDVSRIRTAYYGVDHEFYTSRAHPLGEQPVVAWAGRIDPLKDVETLLEAAALVRDARPEVRFRLYGSAPIGNEEYHRRCLALHDRLGLADTVTFEGFSSNVMEAFAEADLVVLSSISEGFPFSTLQAMLCGRPVVATGVGGIGEQVTPDCGRVVRPRDPRALAAAILDVCASAATCQALSDAARERVVSLFGIERFRVVHRAIYDLATPGHVEPAPEAFPLSARLAPAEPQPASDLTAVGV